MTTNAWIRQNWLDYRLAWNPDEFENITLMHIPTEKLWRPDIILYNNADSYYKQSVTSTDMLVGYRGDVTWSSAAIFKSSCSMDVRYYPFDMQNCVLKFASWSYDGTKIDIKLLSENGDSANFMPSTEWHLEWIRVEKSSIIYSCCPEPYPFIDVQIFIKRRPMFYVFNLILPCLLINTIALLGFYLPSNSGEKVTLGLYYGVTIVIVSLATAMTVFTLNIHEYGEYGEPVPSILQLIAFKFISRILFVDVEPYHSISDHVRHFYEVYEKQKLQRLMGRCSSFDQCIHLQVDSECNGRSDVLPNFRTETKFENRTKNDPQQSTPESAFRRDFLFVLNEVQATIKRSEMRRTEKDRREAVNLQWQQVALVLDRFLLVIFSIGTIMFSFAILQQRQTNFK